MVRDVKGCLKFRYILRDYIPTGDFSHAHVAVLFHNLDYFFNSQENSMLDAKERMMKVNWELIKTQSKVFHEELKSSG